MQWWPVTCRRSWSDVLCSGHIRTSSSCIAQPASGGKSDLFDSTRVWLCRCYIYSRRAVKFFSHMLEKTLGYVTVSVGARTAGEQRWEREREREVVQGHRRLGGLSHSQAVIRSLSLGPEIRGIFMSPPPSSRKGLWEGEGGETRTHTDAHRNPPEMKPRSTYGYRAPPSSALCLRFWVQAVWTLQMTDRSAWDRVSCVCECVLHTKSMQKQVE